MMVIKTSAPIAKIKWSAIDWSEIVLQVKQLQFRIAKAIGDGRHNKAKSLQWLLTHSYYAKLLAIKRVTQNAGSKTAGVDKVIWRSDAQKVKAVAQLNRKSYKTLPLKMNLYTKEEWKITSTIDPIDAMQGYASFTLASFRADCRNTSR